MTNNEFLDELSRICNNPEFENRLKRNKKKKILKMGKACVVSLILIVSSICFLSIYGKQSKHNNLDNTENIDGVEEVTNAQDEVNSETPFPDADCTPEWFLSIDDFKNAIISGEKNYGIESINYYYIPKYLPNEVSLNFVQIKDAYVAIYFSVNGRTDAYYVFEWYRLLKEGQLRTGVLYSFNESSIEKDGDYYIVKDDSTNLTDVFWEEDGMVFHAVVPSDVTPDIWHKFCSSNKVEILSENSKGTD